MTLTKKQLLISLWFVPLLSFLAGCNFALAVESFFEGHPVWGFVSLFFVVALEGTGYLHYRDLRDNLK